MVWADSHHLSRGRWYSGAYPRETSRFSIRGFHPLWRSFPATSATCWFCNSPRGRQTPPDMSHYTGVAKAAAMAPHRFRLFPVRSPLLRESLSVSLPPATKRFYFAGFGSCKSRMAGHLQPGFPIRRSTDHSLLAAPRGLSQLATSFIPSDCRGIHHRPLAAWPILTS